MLVRKQDDMHGCGVSLQAMDARLRRGLRRSKAEDKAGNRASSSNEVVTVLTISIYSRSQYSK